MGRREEAKDERRARIVAAARDLMREIGVNAIAMKQVAARADVSLSTVYNLFESKEDVLARVFNEAFDDYRTAVFERASPDPLQRFFDAVDIAAEFYSGDAPFYRSSAWLIYADSDYKLSLQRPRFGFFRDLAGGAVEQGLLRPDADTHMLSLMVVPMFSAPYQAWTGSWISIDEFRARAKLGICIVLQGFAVPEHRQRLEECVRLLAAQVGRHRGALRQEDIGGGAKTARQDGA